MADPNTQIDWWIAQTWQEAQGGAESDALVAWLHENGLTAISSYTILQAALSCAPEEAKEMVFGHPVWAGEDQDPDIANLDYTSDTLEPEPEPDPSFELDEWADHLEDDGPVYGEEGYEPDPNAGVSLPAKTTTEPVFTAFDKPDGVEQSGGRGQTEDLEEQHFEPFEPDSESLPEPEPAPMDTMPMTAEPMPEPAAAFEQEMPPIPSPEPEPAFAVPPAAETMAEPMREAPPEPLAESEFPPAPPVPAPQPAAAPARPPILRTIPSTPAERAAVFANAFGKKPAAAPPAAAEAEVPAAPPGAVPPSTDMGPAAEAETSPAQSETEPPHPAMATAPMPPPLVYEPLPELEIPQPATAAEPLFSAPHRASQPAPPLFPTVESRQQPADTDLPEADAEPPDESPASKADGYDEQTRGGLAVDDQDEPAEPDLDLDLDPDPDPEPEPEPGTPTDEPERFLEAAVDDIPDDLPSGTSAATESSPADAHDDLEEPREEVETDLPRDVEQESPPLGKSAEGDAEADMEELDHPSDDDAEDEAPRPRKKVLLDPSAKEPDSGRPEELPAGGDTEDEDMAAVAVKLGINFRGADPTEIGVDPETVRAARELGISFREGNDGPEPDLDETALAAQKLGISFREGGLASEKPRKPLVVKYMPMIVVIIITFVLVLLGVTFAGDIIGWLTDPGVRR